MEWLSQVAVEYQRNGVEGAKGTLLESVRGRLASCASSNHKRLIIFGATKQRHTEDYYLIAVVLRLESVFEGDGNCNTLLNTRTSHVLDFENTRIVLTDEGL